MRENGTGGSQEAGNGANLAMGWFGSINGGGCAWPVAVVLDVRECSLIDRLQRRAGA